jgi:VCBS repeat-containing protein
MASEDEKKRAEAGEEHTQGVPTGTQIIGTYAITEMIAAGGMGEVYRGENIHTNQSVAIKIVLAELAEDVTILSLFQREATILGDLNHEAIVRYHIFTKDPILKRACLVMEFVEGRPLADIIVEAPLSEADVRELLARIAPGLQRAHDLGVVHRDLSPDNIIVQDGMISHAKIIDFGIAKSGTETKHGKTVLGDRFAGKYNYVSPEQLFLYKGIVTGKSDIYSLGLVAVACLAGQALAMGESIPDAMDKRSSVPDLSGVPKSMRPLLSWMLQPDPANRPESMAQVSEALENPAVIPQFIAAASGGAATIPPRAMTLEEDAVSSQPPTSWDLKQGSTAPPSQSQPGQSPTSMPGDGAFSAPPVDAFGTAVAGPNPDATQIALPGRGSVPPASVPPASAEAPNVTMVPSDASAPLGNDEDSPFGNDAQPAAPAPAAPEPAAPAPEEKKKSSLVPILAVLLLLGGGGGAYMAGLFDGAPPAPPVVSNDVAALDADGTVTGQVLANDVAPETGGTLSVVAVNGASENVGKALVLASGASVRVAADGSFSYDPTGAFDTVDRGQTATDTFTYQAAVAEGPNSAPATVTITINGVGEAPVATDNTYSTPSDRLLTGNLISDDTAGLGADTDGNGDALEVTLINGEPLGEGPVTLQTGATVRVLSNGSFTFDPVGLEPRPDAGARLESSFTYTVSDGSGRSDQGTVRIAAIGVPPVEEDPVENGSADVADPGTETGNGAASNSQTGTNVDNSLSVIAERVAWIENYAMPACTHTEILSVTESDIEIEGYGTTAEPFIRMLADFQRDNGVEPSIGVRIVTDRQCPAVTFLHQLARTDYVQPKLSLDADVLAFGSALTGQITDVNDREIWFILVDHRGRFYDITGLLLPRDDGSYRFGIQLQGASENAEPQPQMLIAVASDRPLETRTTRTERIDDITALLQAEIAQKGIKASASAAYFRLQNE